MSVAIQPGDFDAATEIEQLGANSRSIGAVVSFIGLVRDSNLGQEVGSLFLEHYPGMAEQEIARIVDEARQRWPLEAWRVVHRVGQLKPSDPIVFVGVASRHRGDAFAACEYIIDHLKTRVPFWKKEQVVTAAGQLESQWLDKRESDIEKVRGDRDQSLP